MNSKVEKMNVLALELMHEIERAFLEWRKLEAIRASHSAIIHSKEILAVK